MRPNRLRNFLRKWIRAFVRIRLGLCAMLLLAFGAAWGLVYYSGTPRYRARLEADVLGAERDHFLETTAPLLLTRLQTPDRMLAYAREKIRTDKPGDRRRAVLDADDFERFKKRITFGMEDNARLCATYNSPELKGAERVLMAVRKKLVYEYEKAKIDTENAPSSAGVLKWRLAKKDEERAGLKTRAEDLKIAEPRTIPLRKWTPAALKIKVAELDRMIALAEEDFSELNALYSFREEQKAKMGGEKRISAEEDKVISPSNAAIRSKIAKLRAELAELMYDATPLHPSVTERKSAIEELQSALQQLGEQFVSKTVKYVPNPEYTALTSEIRRLAGERVALRQKINHNNGERAMLQKMLDDNPIMVKDYADVMEKIGRLEEETTELRKKYRNAAAQEEVNTHNRARLDIERMRLLVARRPLSSIYGKPFGLAIIVVAAAGLILSMIMALTDSAVRNIEDVNDLRIPVLGAVGEIGWGFRNLRDWLLVGTLLVLLASYAAILVIQEGGKDAKDFVADMGGVEEEPAEEEPTREGKKPAEREKPIRKVPGAEEPTSVGEPPAAEEGPPPRSTRYATPDDEVKEPTVKPKEAYIPPAAEE